VRATIGSLVTVNGWALEAVALDRESIVPIYRQLYERLREQILTGALPEGTRLPPERALAERLGVNRSTVVRTHPILDACPTPA
jgi:DNA-binding transcriptional regulator YhcF (GntR family)